MTRAQKALLIIEFLASEMECQSFTVKDQDQLEMWGRIYKLAHVGTYPRCKHPDWVRELDESYIEFKKGGAF